LRRRERREEKRKKRERKKKSRTHINAGASYLLVDAFQKVEEEPTVGERGSKGKERKSSALSKREDGTRGKKGKKEEKKRYERLGVPPRSSFLKMSTTENTQRNGGK